MRRRPCRTLSAPLPSTPAKAPVAEWVDVQTQETPLDEEIVTEKSFIMLEEVTDVDMDSVHSGSCHHSARSRGHGHPPHHGFPRDRRGGRGRPPARSSETWPGDASHPFLDSPRQQLRRNPQCQRFAIGIHEGGARGQPTQMACVAEGLPALVRELVQDLQLILDEPTFDCGSVW